MKEKLVNHYGLKPKTARNLVHATKSVPMMEEITPRWFLNLLPWVPVEAGIYRVNKLKKSFENPGKLKFDNGKHTGVHIKHLNQIPPFKYVNKPFIDNLASLFKKERYGLGDPVAGAKVEGDVFFIVAGGKVEVTTSGKQGKKINIGILSKGDYSNVNAFVEKSNRPVTIKALTSCEIFYLDRPSFDNCLDNTPDMKKSYDNALNIWTENNKKTNEYGEKLIDTHSGELGNHSYPQTYPDYEEKPREYILSYVQTILKVNTHVTDIFNTPINQMHEQMRLTVEAMKEKQEWEMINNTDFGLANSVAPSMRLSTRKGVPTPDDMDELLARVWKKPAFFLAHPKAIAAFTRECTRRGVPPVTINIYGSPFITWRGVPLIPCDKLLVNGRSCHNIRCGTTSILLLRVGEKEQGVVGLHQPGIPDEKSNPSLSVKFAGIDNAGVASYVLSLYFSLAVLTDDALGMLEDVEVGFYHDYE